MSLDMSNLPSTRNAKLPSVYVEAKAALEKCQQVDECKSWADKAAALASYARQADDKSLLTTAVRIQARAIRRCGELLRAIEPTKPPGKKIGMGAPTDLGSARKRAATSAGLSRGQQVQAERVAAVPSATFERAVEAPKPATVTKLAEMGKKQAKARAYLESEKPPGFKDATHTLGTLNRLAEFARTANTAEIVAAISKHERKYALGNAVVAARWIARLISHLRST